MNLWSILATIVEQTLKVKNTFRVIRRTVLTNLSSSEMVKVSIQSSNFRLNPSLQLASLLLAFPLLASLPSTHLAYLRFMHLGIGNPSRRKKKVYPQHTLIYESIYKYQLINKHIYLGGRKKEKEEEKRSHMFSHANI